MIPSRVMDMWSTVVKQSAVWQTLAGLWRQETRDNVGHHVLYLKMEHLRFLSLHHASTLSAQGHLPPSFRSDDAPRPLLQTLLQSREKFIQEAPPVLDRFLADAKAISAPTLSFPTIDITLHLMRGIRVILSELSSKDKAIAENGQYAEEVESLLRQAFAPLLKGRNNHSLSPSATSVIQSLYMTIAPLFTFCTHLLADPQSAAEHWQMDMGGDGLWTRAFQKTLLQIATTAHEGLLRRTDHLVVDRTSRDDSTIRIAFGGTPRLQTVKTELVAWSQEVERVYPVVEAVHPAPKEEAPVKQPSDAVLRELQREMVQKQQKLDDATMHVSVLTHRLQTAQEEIITSKATFQKTLASAEERAATALADLQASQSRALQPTPAKEAVDPRQRLAELRRTSPTTTASSASNEASQPVVESLRLALKSLREENTRLRSQQLLSQYGNCLKAPASPPSRERQRALQAQISVLQGRLHDHMASRRLLVEEEKSKGWQSKRKSKAVQSIQRAEERARLQEAWQQIDAAVVSHTPCKKESAYPVIGRLSFAENAAEKVAVPLTSSAWASLHAAFLDR